MANKARKRDAGPDLAHTLVFGIKEMLLVFWMSRNTGMMDLMNLRASPSPELVYEHLPLLKGRPNSQVFRSCSVP